MIQTHTHWAVMAGWAGPSESTSVARKHHGESESKGLTRHTHKRTHTCMNAYTHAHTYTHTLHHHHRHHRNYYHHHNNIFLILPYDPPTSQEAAMARSTYAEELFGTINSTDFSLNLSKPCLEDTALKNMVPLWHLETQMYWGAMDLGYFFWESLTFSSSVELFITPLNGY